MQALLQRARDPVTVSALDPEGISEIAWVSATLRLPEKACPKPMLSALLRLSAKSHPFPLLCPGLPPALRSTPRVC